MGGIGYAYDDTFTKEEIESILNTFMAYDLISCIVISSVPPPKSNTKTFFFSLKSIMQFEISPLCI